MADDLQQALALQRAGKLGAAESAFKKILERQPGHPVASFQLGTVHLQRGDAAGAIPLLEAGVAAMPDQPMVYLPLGAAYMQTGNPARAEQVFITAVERNLDLPQAHVSLGLARCSQRNFDAGIPNLETAARLSNNAPPFRFELGQALFFAGRNAEAIPHLQAAMDAQPAEPRFRHTLGKAYLEIGRYADAEREFTRLLQDQPAHPVAGFDLARCHVERHRHDDALTVLEPLLAEQPEHLEGLLLMGLTRERLADPDAASKCYEAAARQAPDDPVIGDHQLRLLAYRSSLTPEQARARAEQLTRDYLQAPSPEPHRNNPSPNRRLTVGFLSPDFRTHSVAYFLEKLFAHLDRERVELYCFAHVKQEDGVTKSLRQQADLWTDVTGMDAEQAAREIRGHRLDVLIDLAGHTSGNRLDIMAHSPAPVQVTWLGSPMTTGMSAIGYRLTDGRADPDAFDSHCTETLVRLPETFLCYAPDPDAPEPGPPPCADGEPVTFGSFNNFSKLNEPVVATWAAVLNAVPESRMLIKAAAAETRAGRERLLGWFAKHGIGADRLELVGRLPDKADHLRLYHKVDIGLDTFPYNGTTTTCEALWMGVPVIALAGDRHMGRVGVSLLTSVGLPELIAPTPEAFVETAAALAADRNRLGELHRELRGRMNGSPLCDGPAFARNFEAALRGMWREWCQSH